MSTGADTVTGGDALLRVEVPRSVRRDQVEVSVDGRDVTSAFAPDPADGRNLLGIVDGLELGENTIEATADRKGKRRGRGDPSAEVVVTNHPITGPVFSGPHQEPFICQTEAFGLGPALDEDCSAETQVEYVYRTTDGSFEPLRPDWADPG